MLNQFVMVGRLLKIYDTGVITILLSVEDHEYEIYILKECMPALLKAGEGALVGVKGKVVIDTDLELKLFAGAVSILQQ